MLTKTTKGWDERIELVVEIRIQPFLIGYGNRLQQGRSYLPSACASGIGGPARVPFETD